MDSTRLGRAELPNTQIKTGGAKQVTIKRLDDITYNIKSSRLSLIRNSKIRNKLEVFFLFDLQVFLFNFGTINQSRNTYLLSAYYFYL